MLRSAFLREGIGRKSLVRGGGGAAVCGREVHGEEAASHPSLLVHCALEVLRPNIDLPFGTVLRLTSPLLRHSSPLLRPVCLALSHPSVTGESFVAFLCFLSVLVIWGGSLYPLCPCLFVFSLWFLSCF